MSTDPTPSRQSLQRSRRAASQASAPNSAAKSATESAAPEVTPDPAAAEAAPPETPSSAIAANQPNSLAINPRRKRYAHNNRPVDPSPIQVSQTVRIAGLRPIGVSPDLNGSTNFSQSSTRMNRPIASNSDPRDDEMFGYLD